jgi:hypothetical protein
VCSRDQPGPAVLPRPPATLPCHRTTITRVIVDVWSNPSLPGAPTQTAIGSQAPLEP